MQKRGGLLVTGMGVVLLGALLNAGCGQVACSAARLHGYRGNCFPAQCAPESLQAGYCIKQQQTSEQRGEQK